MPVLSSDEALIKFLRVEENGWNDDHMVCEFPARQWKIRALMDLVQKLTKI